MPGDSKKRELTEKDIESYFKSSQRKTKFSSSEFANAFKAIKERANDVDNTLAQIDESTTSLIKNFGGARDRVQEMALGISDASSKILLLTDNVSTYEEAMAKAATIANEVAEGTNRNYMATSQNIEEIVAATEASKVESGTLIKNFTEQGYSLNAISENMQKVVNTTRALGVNTAAVSSSVVANLSKLNTFNFANGIEGLTRMAAKAALFNIDMTKIFTLADNLFDPEKAVEMASSLQRLGVATGDLLDPLKLMDLGQNNPEELQKQIVEMSKRFTYFNEQNQKFEIMPGAKRELREIAGAMGLNADELAKMALGSSTLADKMSKIRFPTLKTDITEDQKELIANMSEMKDGKYMIKVERRDKEGRGLGEFDSKDVSLLDDTDIENLKKQYSESNKTLEETAQDQLTIQKRMLNEMESVASSLRGGLATSRPVRKGIEEVIKFKDKTIEPITDAATSKNARELIDDIVTDLANYTKNKTSGQYSDEEIKKQEDAINEKYKDKLVKLENSINKAGDVLGKAATDLGSGLLNAILGSGSEILKVPEKPKEPAESILQKEGTGLQILENVYNLSRQNEDASQKSQINPNANTTSIPSLSNADKTIKNNFAQNNQTQNQSTVNNVTQQSDMIATLKNNEETVNQLKILNDVSKTGFADLIKSSEKPTKLDISDLTLEDKSVASKNTENASLNFAENAKTKNDDKLINTLPYDSSLLRKFDNTLNTTLNNPQTTNNNNLTEFSNNLNQYSSLKTTDNYNQFSSLVNQNSSQNLLSGPFSPDQKSTKFGLNIPYVTPGLTFNKVDNTKKEDNITTAPVASNLNNNQPIENKRFIGGTDYDFNSLIGILLQNNKPNTTSLTNSENNFKNLSNQITENKALSTTNINNLPNEINKVTEDNKSIEKLQELIDVSKSGFADMLKKQISLDLSNVDFAKFVKVDEKSNIRPVSESKILSETKQTEKLINVLSEKETPLPQPVTTNSSVENSENIVKNLSNQITENKALSTTNINNLPNENLFKEDKSLNNIEIDIDKQMSGFADLFKSFDEKSQNLFNGQIAKKEEDSIQIPNISLVSNNVTPNSLESPLTDNRFKNTITPNPITESITKNTFDQKIKEYSQSTETKKGEFTHNHTIDFNIKVDAPPGVDTAYITDVMTKVLKQPQTIAALIQEQKNMKSDYNLTGGKVGEYNFTA